MPAYYLSLITVLILSCVISVYAEDGTISGRFEIEAGGSISEDWKVYFYNASTGPPPSEDKYWRVPDHVDSVDHEDRFFVSLPEGEYYVAGLKRAGGPGIIGPPLKGDLLTMSLDEKGGGVRRHSVKKGEITKVDVLTRATVSEGCGFKMAEDITGVGGIIRDSSGKPVEGSMVLAYVDAASIMGKPMFVSGRTGPDGKYLIRFDKGGVYYFRVRDIIGGGRPVTGEIIGERVTGHPAGAAVKTGEIKEGIDIRIMRFSRRGIGVNRSGD